MLKQLSRTALLSLALALAACASLGEKTDETKNWSADKLYAEAADELKSGNYEKSIKYFEKLESRYPFGAYAQQAQMQIAYAYYKQNEQAQCLAAIERFIRLHPNHPNVDYMYYLRGLANFKDKKGLLDFISEQDPTERDPKSVRAAFDAFKQLIDRYPNSQYVPDARDRLNYLLDAMAQYEVHVANYYYRRGAYVAAVNRAQNVVRDYPGSESAKSALRIQVLSYEAMGMKELRDDAERVYQLNFSEADAANASGTKKPWWRVW
ncbi:MAG: outer membrane protein assembly factor BamD [Burkholderiaceae bacterium]|jgi:outer membrane protein assembly factor BamD|nr:outer membrane protein assembly factor BamD [Oxalobacteraceae bacterium]